MKCDSGDCLLARLDQLWSLVPAKLMREWKLLFEKGQPLYECVEPEVHEFSTELVLEEERQNLLDDADFMEYRSMTGEWLPPVNCTVKEPPRDNPVVSHIVQRLFYIAHPPTPPPAVPEFPSFPVRACVLGKAFSGKSTCLKRLAAEHNLCVLDPVILVQGAVEAFKDGELEVADEEVQVDFSENIEDDPSAGHISLLPDVDNTSELEKNTLDSDVVSMMTGISDAPEAANIIRAESTHLSKSSTPAREHSHMPQLTTRAQLGSKAMACLKKGLPVDDQIVVEILAEAIRKVPEGTSWILEGYPQNYTQAKLLEKALSGCDASQVEHKQKEFQKIHKNSLVPYSQAKREQSTPPSGIDVVILFDIRDELCLKRAAGRYQQILAEKTFHEEFDPPPQGSATGVGKVEKVQPVSDQYYDKEHIQTRITGFVNHWPKLQKWFLKYGTLKIVDASLEKEAIFQETEKILEDTINRFYKQDEHVETEDKQEEKEMAPGGPPEAAPSEISSLEVPAPGGPDARPSRLLSKEGSPRASSSPKDKKSRSPKGKKSDAGSPKRKGSRGSAASDKKKSQPSKSHEAEIHQEPEVPAGPPPPKPGDEDWIFVNLDIDTELATVLMCHWEEVEKAYVRHLKTVFRNIRSERENIYRYFFQIKKDYVQYLSKPDCKQEYVTQWQQTYNEVADDLRDDEEVKAELHQQVDDLVERLWSICDERKEAAENERLLIMNNGWLDDRTGILTNHYLTVMQAELDRFQDTVRLLKDYYRGMDGLIPDVLNNDYERLPLVELSFEKPGTGQSETSLTDEEKLIDKGERLSKSPRQSPKELKSATSKKRYSEFDNEKVEEQSTDGAGHRITIPLIHRYASTDKISVKESKDKLTVRKERHDRESIMPPLDPDERQIYDGYTFAVGAINDIVLAEMAVKEAEDEAERQRDLDKERAAKKGGKGIKKTASPLLKKNSKQREQDLLVSQIPDVGEQNEEELLKKQVKARAREELYCGIEEEGQAAKARLEIVRLLASAVLQDFKFQGDEAFCALFDWLGAKFLKEMESISQMALLLHNAIELGQKIKNEIILEIDNFILDEDLKVLKTPSPEPPPSPVEQPMANHFTVSQLEHLYHQLKEIAPAGIISKKAFTEMLTSLVSVTHGTEVLPELWMQLTPAQVELLSSLLSPELDFIDWRRLLVALCYPVPAPTQADLLHYLKQFTKIDQRQSGSVTREQWQWIPLWFGQEPPLEESYDRTTNLKNLLFEVFANHSGSISLLDYVDFLMYFSVAANYHEGFLRALSIATGTHMPRLDKPVLPATVQLRKSQNHLVEGADTKDKDKTTAEPPMSHEVIPPEAEHAEVPLEALYKVLHHSDIRGGDSHRFYATADPDDHRSIERLIALYRELNDDDSTAPIMYRVLIEHPVIQDVVVACRQFQSVDLTFLSQVPGEGSEVPASATLE